MTCIAFFQSFFSRAFKLFGSIVSDFWRMQGPKTNCKKNELIVQTCYKKLRLLTEQLVTNKLIELTFCGGTSSWGNKIHVPKGGNNIKVLGGGGIKFP